MIRGKVSARPVLTGKVVGPVITDGGYERGYEEGEAAGYEKGYTDGEAVSYDQGYTAGQASMVDESKIIEKTVTGTRVVTVDDVSEIPHEVTVQLSGGGLTDYSGVMVNRLRKNLFDGVLTAGLLVDAEGTPATGSGYAEKYRFLFVDLPAGTYTVSFSETVTMVRLVMNGEYSNIGIQSTNVTYTIEGGNFGLCFRNSAETAWVDGSVDIQIEPGSAATEYEPYNAADAEELAVNADGSCSCGSLCPSITILADADVDISLTYRKSWGRQSECDRQWGIRQQYGKRTVYDYCYAGESWTDSASPPKYDMSPVSASYMFNTCFISDIPAWLEKGGVSLSFANCNSFTYTFTSSRSKRLGIIDTRSASSISYLAYAAQCTTIDEIILKDDGSQKFSGYSFGACKNLEHITFSGVIGQNGLDFRDSTSLSKASHQSIVAALSTTTTGLTVTLSLEAVNNAFETSEGAADGSTSEEWLALIATRENWTISLA